MTTRIVAAMNDNRQRKPEPLAERDRVRLRIVELAAVRLAPGAWLYRVVTRAERMCLHAAPWTVFTPTIIRGTRAAAPIMELRALGAHVLTPSLICATYHVQQSIPAWRCRMDPPAHLRFTGAGRANSEARLESWQPGYYQILVHARDLRSCTLLRRISICASEDASDSGDAFGLLHLPPRFGGSADSRTTEPGEWRATFQGESNMTDRQAEFQKSVSGRRSVADGYFVRNPETDRDVEFDGYREEEIDGRTRMVLVDAKYYADDSPLFHDKSTQYYRGNALIKQAERQRAAAQGTPVVWYVPSAKAQALFQELMRRNEIDIHIKVHRQ